ncbi:YXWGXW repeat-containing protein [Dyella telluris]|uniref:YXWGXW repeat-containing protein n=1 Tax=Dyella telluris TaxID=2763498 RepID=A0A7G8Q1K2_9GAMM|nr:YXWGXW repeat-containing protein [Dyella telluris]QNK00660.1 YXWGXW repeat-containing protein [Dyella telluris]
MLSTTRRLALLAALGIASAGAMTYAPDAAAGVSVSVAVGVAPPPPRVEEVPPPRAGYVWSPGYWRWDGRQHLWVTGSWVRVRPGYVYRPGHWEHARDGWRWHDNSWGH